MRVFGNARGPRIRNGRREPRPVRHGRPEHRADGARTRSGREPRPPGPWSPRRPWAALPKPALVLLACVPGLLAVAALVTCAAGVDRSATRAAVAPPVTARAAAERPVERPPIVPRSTWLRSADPHRQPPPRYDDRVVAVFVHHTDSPNGYDCADVPRIIGDLYAGQTGAKQWDDIGYNFLVDRCGTIYEGRAGGVDRPVTGAHAQGFNHRTAGIAAIGTFTAGVPVPKAMTDAIARLAAWKLGLGGVDPRGTVRLVSSNSLSRYPKGSTAVLPTIAGHDDGFMTSCPGAALAARLPEIRADAARYQGR